METLVGDKLKIKWETYIGDKLETLVGDKLETLVGDKLETLVGDLLEIRYNGYHKKHKTNLDEQASVVLRRSDFTVLKDGSKGDQELN